MPKSEKTSFRFAEETTKKIDEIAHRQGGLKKTRVLELAVDRLWDELCGSIAQKRSARNPGKQS